MFEHFPSCLCLESWFQIRNRIPSCRWSGRSVRTFTKYHQVKPHNRRDSPTVEFRGEIGTMNAVILCDNHNAYAKKTYDLCDLDEKGRVSVSTQDLRLYAHRRNSNLFRLRYKSSPKPSSRHITVREPMVSSAKLDGWTRSLQRHDSTPCL
jgi:hypothetical protein